MAFHILYTEDRDLPNSSVYMGGVGASKNGFFIFLLLEKVESMKSSVLLRELSDVSVNRLRRGLFLSVSGCPEEFRLTPELRLGATVSPSLWSRVKVEFMLEA